jgi:hypothetical protein
MSFSSFNKRTGSCRFTQLFFLLLMTATAFSQVGTGIIRGVVTDVSGARIGNAEVTVTNTQTGVTEKQITDSAGVYNVPSISIGTYKVQVQNQGFKTAYVNDVVLSVGETKEVNVSLIVGQISQEVSVEAQVAQVDTDTSMVAGRINQTQMRDLPLNGRNFEQLIVLTPGVVPVTNAASAAYIGRSQVYSFTGARPVGQEEQIDGQSIQDFWDRGSGAAVLGTSLGVDAIAEFQTYTSTASSQFGGANGGVNAVTRSGTNKIHGSEYYFARNDVFDAPPRFVPTTGKPPFKRNQFGGTIGGPIKHDKLFYFVNYESLHQTLGESPTVDMPNQAATTFVQNYLAKLTPGTIAYNNEVTVLNALKAIPAPPAGSLDLGNDTSQAIIVGNQTGTENFVTARVNYALSSKDSIFGRMIYDHATLSEPFAANNLDQYPQTAFDHNQFYAMGWSRNITSGLISQAQFNFTRTVQDGETPNRIPAFNCNPTNGYDCFYSVPSVTNVFGLNTPNAPIFHYIQNKFEPKEQMFWTRGAHSISFGLSLIRNQTAANTPVNPAGNYYFNAWGYSATGTPTGNSFLSGQASSFIGALPGEADSNRNFREIDVTGYFQDDWKITPQLTLNMGLRYSFLTNPIEVNNKLFAYVHPFTAIDTGFTNVPHPFITNPSWKNWDPRFGAAYAPFKNGKTVVRAGFGLFHDIFQPRSYGIGYNFSPPFNQVTQPFPAFGVPSGATVPAFTCIAAASQCTSPLPSIHDALGYNVTTTPYIIQYNLNIQQQVPGNWIFTVGYLGSQSSHLLGQIGLNPPINSSPTGTPVFATLQTVNGSSALVTNPRINPLFNDMGEILPIGHSSYNAFQIVANKEMSYGLLLQTNYTFSHCLDNSSATYSVDNGGYVAPPLPAYPLSFNRGNCSFDRKHNASFNLIYNLPFHGRRLIEGWQVTNIVSAHTGLPFTVMCGFDCVGLNQQNSPSLPNINPGVNYHSVVQKGNLNRYYNPALFSQETPGTVGNSPRNGFFGPSLVNDDIGLIKNTKLSERFSLELRVEAFNVFNHPNFSNPNTSLFSGLGVANPSAGKITSTISASGGLPSSRQLQFAEKFVF